MKLHRTTRLLGAAALLAGLIVPAAARAELTGEFDAAVKDFKSSTGAYTTNLNARVYDTTGGIPAHLHTVQIHFPRGASIRQTYIYGKLLCDITVLDFFKRPSDCAGSQFASGTVVLDGRPQLGDPVTANVRMFLGAPTTDDVNSGIAATVFVFVEATSAFQTQILYGKLHRDSGQYSYQLAMPTAVKANDPAVNLNLAELHLVDPGLIVKKPRHGKQKARKLFWTGLPKCSKSNQIFFGVDFKFSDAPPITKQRTFKCSSFLKHFASKKK